MLRGTSHKLIKRALGAILLWDNQTITPNVYHIAGKAAHACGSWRTPRTEIMYKEGGIAYVYLCYGIHEMLNVVASPSEQPRAILIRAIEPTTGIDIMLLRKGMSTLKPNDTTGPRTETKAKGIDRKLNGISLQSDQLW